MIVATAIIISVPAAAAAPAALLSQRLAQADMLEAQVGKLEERYSGLQERTRGVSIELVGLRSDTLKAQSRLSQARVSLHAARQRLRERAVAMYPRAGRTVSVEPLTYYSVVAVRRI
ncbi:MAG: hypothetical protein H7247_15540 [Polaromonas sp.]|nr:hypothetical protein [Gemmatimonadaceae bacterium]